MLNAARLAAAALLAITATAATASTVLIGGGKLQVAGDLTVLYQGDGSSYEFLDLTSTKGMSTGAAVATYGSSGFHVANQSEMTILFNTFGALGFGTANYVEMSGPSVGVSSFITDLGATLVNGTERFTGGWWESGAAAAELYPAGSLYFMSAAVYPVASDNVVSYYGVYMVRDVPAPAPAATALPEPATLSLAGLGLVGAATARRRRVR